MHANICCVIKLASNCKVGLVRVSSVLIIQMCLTAKQEHTVCPIHEA